MNLTEITANCKGGVHISVNRYDGMQPPIRATDIDYYIKAAIEKGERISLPEPHVLQEIIQTETMIELCAFPNKPTKPIRVLYHDLDKAVEVMSTLLEINRD